MLRKSVTPSTTISNRSPSSNKKKSSLPMSVNKTQQASTSTSIENPTVPDDLNSAHIPTSALESRETAVQPISPICPTTEGVPAKLTTLNELEKSKTKENEPVATTIPNSNNNDDNEQQQKQGKSSPLSSLSLLKRTTTKNDKIIDPTELDTEPFNLSLINHLSKANNGTTIIKSPLREVHSAFTTNNLSSFPQQALSNNKSTNTTTTQVGTGIETIANTTNIRTSEADTQLNTENFDSLKENSPITPNKIQNIINTSLTESPGLSPLTCEKSSLNNTAKSDGVGGISGLNKSLISSPEFTNLEERNTEFLNNTLNISPIAIESADKTSTSTIVNNHKTNNVIENADSSKNSSPTGKKLKPSAINLPSSPPDRKPINTTCSPGIKPKPISQLMGRGAQFINMIRNKNIESTPKQLVHTLTMSSSATNTINNPEQQVMLTGQEIQSQQKSKINENFTTITNTNTSNVLTNPSTPVSSTTTTTNINYHNRDLLVFSKTLPPLNASPSVSILKRKLCKESFDETTASGIESPAIKRKRVSFHDPPVSITKEYVKHSEENAHYRSLISSASASASVAVASSSPTDKPHFTR